MVSACPFPHREGAERGGQAEEDEACLLGARLSSWLFLVLGNPEGDKKAEKKTQDDKVRMSSLGQGPRPLPYPGQTPPPAQPSLAQPAEAPLPFSLPSLSPHTHGQTIKGLLVQGTWMQLNLENIPVLGSFSWGRAVKHRNPKLTTYSPPSTSSPASSSLITLWLSIGSKPWRKMIWISREQPGWWGEGA